MAIATNYSIFRSNNITLQVNMIPATPIAGWGLEFILQRHFGGLSGLITKSAASGFGGGQSGITVTNSGQGQFNIAINSPDTESLEFAPLFVVGVLRNMPPCFPSCDAANIGYIHTKIIGQLLERVCFSVTHSSDKNHINFRQYGLPMLFAFEFFPTSGHTMPDLVCVVFFRGSPSEIRQAVVRFYSVSVKAFLAFWSWSDKGEQNKMVNKERTTTTPLFIFAAIIQTNHSVAYRHRDGFHFPPFYDNAPAAAFPPAAPHRSVGSDSVDGKTEKGKGFVGNFGRMILRHGLAPVKQVVVRGGKEASTFLPPRIVS